MTKLVLKLIFYVKFFPWAIKYFIYNWSQIKMIKTGDHYVYKRVKLSFKNKMEYIKQMYNTLYPWQLRLDMTDYDHKQLKKLLNATCQKDGHIRKDR